MQRAVYRTQACAGLPDLSHPVPVSMGLEMQNLEKANWHHPEENLQIK